MALEEHGLKHGNGEIRVTGAAGGVGSIATAVLAHLGSKVAASTGRPETREYLINLGASAIVDRSELAKQPPRPLDTERWAGAIDTVGGSTLASVLTQLKYRASVAACGLVGGNHLDTTVIPFLLRGVNLLGIDSVMCPFERRLEAWRRLTHDLPEDRLDALTQTIPLKATPEWASRILRDEVRGRVVIELPG